MLNDIFYKNVLIILNEQKMTKFELSKRSGISASFLSDLTAGKANPSLKVMESIASALKTPLPLLIEPSSLHETTISSKDGSLLRNIPHGYERVSVMLPAHKAFVVKKWGKEAQKHLKRGLRDKL